MSRVSLLERAAGLFEPRALAEVEKRLLGLLQVETRARDVALYTQRRADGGLARSAVLAGGKGESPEVLTNEPTPRAQALRLGQLVAEPDPAKPAVLWVPFAREGRLVAAARLAQSEAGAFGTREREACAQIAMVATLALDTAQERERLARASLRETLTGLPGRDFLDEVGRTEVHKAHRFGRRLSLLCVDVEGFDAGRTRRCCRRSSARSPAPCARPTCWRPTARAASGSWSPIPTRSAASC